MPGVKGPHRRLGGVRLRGEQLSAGARDRRRAVARADARCLALHLDVVGGIQAAVALGSIAGTLLAGFVLISAFGTRRIVAGVAAALLLLAVAPRPRWLRRTLLELVAIRAAIVTIGWTSYSPCLRESNYYCIRVVVAPVRERADDAGASERRARGIRRAPSI